MKLRRLRSLEIPSQSANYSRVYCLCFKCLQNVLKRFVLLSLRGSRPAPTPSCSGDMLLQIRGGHVWMFSVLLSLLICFCVCDMLSDTRGRHVWLQSARWFPLIESYMWYNCLRFPARLAAGEWAHRAMSQNRCCDFVRCIDVCGHDRQSCV